VLRWSTAAWGAIAATSLFLLITCWFVIEDRSIPIFDAGLHLQLALEVHRELAAGHLTKALTVSVPYPPFPYLVESLGLAIGGIGVAQPILAENFVFIPLLALGCYHVGRLTFGATAGFLAVVFAFGSPLIISMFHVVMIDGPEATMVAVSLWAILASERFSRIGVSALAGLCVGLGMLTKEPAAFFVAGPLVVALLRGGWRRWRGLLAFAVVALAVSLPWYISELSLVNGIASGALTSPSSAGLPADIAPHPLSLDNFEWYAWNLINAQLYMPLFAFAAIGWIWTIIGFLRQRWVSPLAPEITIGAFVGWLGITETFAHDTRYSMPLLVYLAVFGAGWVIHLPRRWSWGLGAALVTVAVVNTVGIIFEVGEDIRLKLPGAQAEFRQNPGFITVSHTGGFLSGRPARDGDLLTTLRALKFEGVRTVVVESRTLFEPDFSEAGISALSAIAGLKAEVWEGGPQTRLTTQDAILLHRPIGPNWRHPCITLSDGTGVWIVIGDPQSKDSSYDCPATEESA
jgi:4-amino-4-deoxy-L-arabinose transferase-like glycosyltransferase